jgi:hypothetical protein
MSRYFISRARIITKVAKYPHVDDYRRAIADTDEKQFLSGFRVETALLVKDLFSYLSRYQIGHYGDA